MHKVIGIGACVQDTIYVIEEYPEENRKLKSMHSLIQGGGPCATALVAARRHGMQAAYIGKFGNDQYGEYLINDLNRNGINTDYCLIQDSAISPHSVVLVNTRAGSRTVVWNPGSVAHLSATEVSDECLFSADVLHFDGHMIEAAKYAAEFARENNIKTSIDAGGMLPGIESLLLYIDFMVPSEEFALKFTGESSCEKAALELYGNYKPEFVVVTQGAQGGMIIDHNGIRKYKSFPAISIDTNGCGDIFHGALIAGISKGMPLDKAAEYASAAAAYKSLNIGTRDNIPTTEQTERFMDNYRIG